MKTTATDKRRQTLACEKKFWAQSFSWIIGADEAGRGPLAGPVVAGAVAIRRQFYNQKKLAPLLQEINDSKKIVPSRRLALFKMLSKNEAIIWGSGMASAAEIDKINILQATKIAMAAAIKKIIKKIGKSKNQRVFCVLDGNFTLDLQFPQTSIIKGDQKVFSIAAASIIAKVTRDNIMARYDKIYPKWEFSRHKGYGTARHLALIKKFGISPIHRKTFSPIKGLSCVGF
jgi:ribonuclease HII